LVVPLVVMVLVKYPVLEQVIYLAQEQWLEMAHQVQPIPVRVALVASHQVAAETAQAVF
jgi:hypothetical protein